MPRLWADTVDAHRREVHDAILDAAWDLVVEHGLFAVTMSAIAERVGIGRATLYKYFPDVESILRAQHDRHVAEHLERLRAIARTEAEPGRRLERILRAYADIVRYRRHHGSAELGSLLHRQEGVAHAESEVHHLIRNVLVEVAATGAVRTDVDPDELANYCVHALAGAARLPSEAAVRRLVHVTLTGLQR